MCIKSAANYLEISVGGRFIFTEKSSSMQTSKNVSNLNEAYETFFY